MAECLEYIRLSSSIPLSCSRFVLIKSKINKLRNLLPFIQMGAAKCSFTASDGETWRWIVLEYGSKMVAFSEAVKLLEAQSRYRTFRIDLISHQLAFLEKIERDCFQFSCPKTSVSITNPPNDITESDWVALLSEFGEDVSVEKRRISKGNTVVIASFNTMAEAVSVVYELHCLEIEGTKLGVSVLKKKKELHLLDAYKKYYFQCPCLLNKRDCNRTLEEEPTEGKESERIQIPCRTSRICAFCHYPEDHSTTVEGLGIEISTLVDDRFPEMKDVSEALDLTNYWEFDECLTLSLNGNVDDILNYSGTEKYNTSDLSDY